MALLAWLHARVPDVRVYRAAELGGTPTSADPTNPAPVVSASRTTFVLFAVFAALTEFGLLSFGVISFHLAAANLASVAAVPLVYALGMAVAALAAAATGWAYDAAGALVLLTVPVMTAFVPGLVFGGGLSAVLVGVAIWGAATGIQDSTVKALVADLVPDERRGSAYGWFSVFQGAGAFLGGTVAGALYGRTTMLVFIVGILQAVAFGILLVQLRRRPRTTARTS
jgi:MFS family permease